MASKPTERTLAWCRGRGWIIGVVERWLPKRGGMTHGRRQDLFGCIDMIAVAPGELGACGIQATSTSNMMARVHKVLDEEDIAARAKLWLQAGNRLEVWGWSKRGRAGKRKLWKLRRIALVLRSGRLDYVKLEDCT